MDDEFKDLQRLLRLKRHEAPPPAYFEDFLVDFHRRQREEMLKRSVWRLMLDRIEGAIPSFTLSPSRYAYAGACATAVAATVLASSHILSSGAVGVAVASAPGAPTPARRNFHVPSPAWVVSNDLPASPRINLNSRASSRIFPEVDFDRPRPVQASYTTANSRPRYVLDTQPVSYELPHSF